MSDVYLDVTNKIVSALSQGVIPWIKPWTTTGSNADSPFPINAITRRLTPASTFLCCGPRRACEVSPRIAG